MRNTLGIVLSVILLLGAPAHAADDIQRKPVQFSKGSSSATITGQIKGRQSIDYTVRAKAGQSMSVSLKTSNGGNFFNVLPPGSKDVALFVGSSDGNDWTGPLPADGEYKLRVYLMRAEARRNESASYTLTVSVTGAGKPAGFGKAPASDAKDKSTGYHATGPLPCRMGTDKPVDCQFGVIRGKSGNAEVHITPPGGLKRVLTFMGENVTTSQGEKLKAVKKGDEWSIDVNDFEHYSIPDAVISGG